MKLFKAMATVAGLTGLSRIAGFIRDIMTAIIMGAGPVADAFFVALKLPNLFRRITAEGAFSVSFVPLYAESLKKDGQNEADSFASDAFAVMLWSLLVLTLLAMLAMPWVVHVIAPGFAGGDVRHGLATEMARITFPYLLLMSLAALLGGILNAHNRFAPFAFAPVLFNLSLIAALLAAGWFETAGHAMAWGVLVAGLLQFGLLYICARRAGISLKLVRPRLTPRVQRLLKLMGPGVVGAGVMHINLLADLIIASFLAAGSISYLYYADRLNQLPLGMVGIAVGTALLPMLSRALAAANAEEARHLFNRALEICLFLALPAAVGLFFAASPIIVTLFQHGAFTIADAAVTSSVLAAYAVGIPAYILVKVYATAYWANQDTLTPVKAAVAATIFNIGLSLYLALYAGLGVTGIAAATSLAGWLQIALLSRGLKAHAETQLDARFKSTGLKIFFCCILLAAFLWVMKQLTMDVYYDGASVASKAFYLGVIVGGGAALYGVSALATGAIKISELKKFIKRQDR